nr:uncharacterized protein LOC112210898 [Halyomorpha halys]
MDSTPISNNPDEKPGHSRAEKSSTLHPATEDDKSEITVNRQMLEGIVSETFEQVYPEEDKFKSLAEAKLLIEKCKKLEAEQNLLNRERKVLEDRIENASLLAKQLINEKDVLCDYCTGKKQV